MKNEVKNAIVITITVILILVVVYLTTAIFMTGEIGNKKKDEKNEVTNVAEESQTSTLYDNMIIASKTFKQKNDEYMVIFFSQKDASDTLKNIISTYDSSDKETKLYKVNTDEAINKFVVSDEANSSATNYNELKINDTTLVTIKNGVITLYIVAEDNVIEALN